MIDLIRAIERFEEALETGSADTFQAEAALRTLLVLAHDDHDAICARFAEGCTEGVSYNGTIYAPGFSDSGQPLVIVMRRTTELRVPDLAVLSAEVN